MGAETEARELTAAAGDFAAPTSADLPSGASAEAMGSADLETLGFAEDADIDPPGFAQSEDIETLTEGEALLIAADLCGRFVQAVAAGEACGVVLQVKAREGRRRAGRSWAWGDTATVPADAITIAQLNSLFDDDGFDIGFAES